MNDDLQTTAALPLLKKIPVYTEQEVGEAPIWYKHFG
jgi:hypothetical protein